MLLAGVRDFPAQMGAGPATAELHRRGPVRRRLAAADVGRPDADALLPGRDRERQRARPSATTTSGGCRRPTTPTAAPTRATGTSATGRCSARARPARRSAPTSPGATPPRSRCASRCSRPATRRFAQPCLLAAEHIFDLADTTPERQPATAIPFSFYPETEWRDDLELGADRAVPRARGAAGSPAGLPHTDPRFYLAAGRALGERVHHRAERRRRHAEPLRRERARPLRAAPGDRAGAATRPGSTTTQRRCSPTCRRQLDGAVAQAATDPFGFGFPWAPWDTTSHGAGLPVMASEYDAAHRHSTVRELGDPLARRTSSARTPGARRYRRRRHDVPALHAAPGREPRRLARRHAAGPGRRRGRGPERRRSTTGSLTGMRACPADGGDAFAPVQRQTARSSRTTSSRSRPSSRRST